MFLVNDLLDKIVVTNEDGSWKFKGNGFLCGLEMVRARTMRSVKADGSINTESGLWWEINENGDFGFQTAVVTGYGLPSLGLRMVKSGGQLVIDPRDQNSSLQKQTLYRMDDATISQMPDNTVYTIKINDAGGNLILTRNKVIRKRPFMISELSDEHFPTLSGIVSHTLSAAHIGGELAFAYIKPAAYQTALMNATLVYYDSDSSHKAKYDKFLRLDRTSDSFTSVMPDTWTPTRAYFNIIIVDTNNGSIWYRWVFQ